MDGWVEVGNKPHSTIPVFCPKCNGKLNKTDASRLIGLIFVWCDSRGHRLIEPCRWCDFLKHNAYIVG